MALVTEQSKFVIPELYFPISHSHIKDLKLETATVSAQCENWSRLDTFQKVTEIKPHENKVVLSNGREYTYKALVLATGFDHKSENIEGLT